MTATQSCWLHYQLQMVYVNTSCASYCGEIIPNGTCTHTSEALSFSLIFLSIDSYNLKGGKHRVAQDNHITKNHSTKKNNPRPTACFINILIIDTTVLIIYLNRKWKIT